MAFDYEALAAGLSEDNKRQTVVLEAFIRRIAELEAALRSARSQLVTLGGEALHAHGDMVQSAVLAEIDAALTGKG